MSLFFCATWNFHENPMKPWFSKWAHFWLINPPKTGRKEVHTS
jgi:hypothetical protein